MGILERVRENRLKRKELLEKTLDDAKEIQKQKIKTRESIAKEIINREKRDIDINVCPFLGGNKGMIELTKDPDNVEEPFGWPKGTVRGILTLWISTGFILITMLMIFLLNLPLSMIFDMWKIFAGVFGLIVASYFYSRIKMGKNGNMFNPFGW